MVTLNPYLNFESNAREAMEFYRSVFGGELTSSTFSEYGQAENPADADKIMHSQLESGDIVLMGADTPSYLEYAGAGNVSVSLSGSADEDAKLRGYWEKLSGSGSVTVPLEVAPWGDAFGMCVDGYGIAWLVNIAGSQA